jgi:thiamine biosynthesis lipoprotein ApbE
MLGNVRWAAAGASWQEPPMLWAALVGGPSSSKSPSIDAAFKLVRYVEDRMSEDSEIERMKYDTAKEVAEAQTEEWKVRVIAACEEGR